MKYRHYAPKAPVTVVTGGAKVSARYLLTHAGEKSGIICFDEFARLFDGHIVHPLGASDDKRAQAQHVFDALRTFDETNVGEIWAQCPDSKGLGLAIGNRLKKAAGFHVEDADDGKIVIGITGGTGAGKTSLLRALERKGACVLDCDAVYHEMLKDDEPLLRALREAFGDVIFRQDGSVDVHAIGLIVFKDRKSSPSSTPSCMSASRARWRRKWRRRTRRSSASMLSSSSRAALARSATRPSP